MPTINFPPSQGGNGDGGLRNGENCFTLLTPSTAQQDSENEMWNVYLDEVKEDDKQIADSWKEGSAGILTFVSPDLLMFCSSQ
jgi:hypothetical protein